MSIQNPTPKKKYTQTFKDQFKETKRLDPYRSECKPQGTPRCPVCKAVNVRGRWISSAHLKTLQPTVLVTGKLTCPACHQKEDHFALGVIELHDEEWKSKKKEVIETIKNTEEIARSRNDQERVLWIQDMGNVTKVYVSLPELARHIGRELERAFHGMIEYDHSTEEPYLRVRWWPDLPHMKHRPGSSLTLKRKAMAVEHEKRLLHKSKAFRTRSRRP